jgi:hypothetical protein
LKSGIEPGELVRDPPAAEDAAMLLLALMRRGEDIVDRLLGENENRWQSMSPRDRRTVELVARDVAARMLGQPAQRLEDGHARELRDLFGL